MNYLPKIQEIDVYVNQYLNNNEYLIGSNDNENIQPKYFIISTESLINTEQTYNNKKCSL